MIDDATVVSLRPASLGGLGLLVVFNHQLIADQAHDNPAGPDQLADRMRGWLTDPRHQVTIADQDGVPVGYAVWSRDEHEGTYLRQLFVDRPFRRTGVGRSIGTELRRPGSSGWMCCSTQTRGCLPGPSGPALSRSGADPGPSPPGSETCKPNAVRW